MNIFVSDACPIKSAEYLDDKRVIKMILESAQLMCTAAHAFGCEAVYRSTHANHPCSIWVRHSRENYLWLLDHFDALCAEYTKRYAKRHKCEDYRHLFAQYALLIPNLGRTPFVNCTNFKNISDVHEAYKLCLQEKWKNDKKIPTFFKKPVTNLK